MAAVSGCERAPSLCAYLYQINRQRMEKLNTNYAPQSQGREAASCEFSKQEDAEVTSGIKTFCAIGQKCFT